MELPKIISVDDHVVEPAHVWQTWLPEKHREKGPRVERKRWGAFKIKKGAKYEMTEDPEGEWGDAWIYEDQVIYVQKKFVAIPKSATQGDDVSTFDKTVMTMTATTYDDMRPGCYDAKERKKDFEINWVDGSLPFPTFPRFCGQTFYEADDQELALACVQAYNDWMVEEWCDPSIGINIPLGIMPLWDAELAAKEIERNAARGVRAVCFSELPDPARPAEHPHRLLGPDVRGVQRHRDDGVHARRVVVDRPVLVEGRARGRRQHGRVQQLDGVAGRLPLRRDHASVPEAEDRVLGGPDRMAAVRARASRHRVGGAQRLAELQASVPRAAVDLLLRPRLRLLHVGPPRREIARRGR